MHNASTQEVRLAVVMTGGASLAVWMGGVATEINLAVGAHSAAPAEAARPAEAADAAVAARYARLMEILDVELAVDVLAGASAGGINATMLGFAGAHRASLAPLRDLWLSLGALETLMRTPDDRTFPSLLRGNEAVLPALRTALHAIAATATPHQPPVARPTSMFVTTTILRGEVREHTDSLGSTMYDVDYRGLFAFGTPDLTDPGAIPRLALAARASSAFPGAFEPAYVPVGHAVDDAHPDMARYVNSARGFFASDGGILVNRPIGPALAAVFDQPAARQVRRVLTYVVPSPRPTGQALDPAARAPRDSAPRDSAPRDSAPRSAGDGTARRGDAPLRPPTPPAAGGTLIGALDAALNQSIGTDLTALRAHNDAVRGLRATRRRLLRLAPAGTARLADASVYEAYRRGMAERISAPVVEALLRVLTDRADLPHPPDADTVRTNAAARVRMTATAADAVFAALPDQLPGTADLDQLGRLGQPALDGVKGILIAMINEGYVLCPEPDERARLARIAAAVHDAAPPVADTGTAGGAPRPGPFTTVTETLAAMPTAPTGTIAAEATRRWLHGDPRGTHGHRRLHDSWQALLPVVMHTRAEFASIVRHHTSATSRTADRRTPVGPDARKRGLTVAQRRSLAARTMGDFVDYLPTDGSAAVIALLDLHLLEYETSGAVLDQPVELVQLSADLPNTLDPSRQLAEDKLTGLRLGNFAAFAKASWRANDWMWGRLDGAGWLVRILLDPRRLIARRDLAVPPGPQAAGAQAAGAQAAGAQAALARRGWLTGLVDDLRAVAGCPAGPEVLEELSFLLDPQEPVPPSLPITAAWVATGPQRDIAAAELVGLAHTVRQDNASGIDPRPTAAFLTAVDQALAPTNTPSTHTPSTHTPSVVQGDAAVISLAAAAAARVAAREAGTGTATPTAATAAAACRSRIPGPDSDQPVAPGLLPPGAVDVVLRACRVSDERITDSAQGPILVSDLAQIVAVVTAWLTTARLVPRPVRPVAFLARTAARLSYELVRDVAHGRRRVMIALGVVLVALGTAAGVICSGFPGAFGIVVALLGLLVLGVPSRRRLPGGLAVVAAGALVVVAAAGAIPVLRDPLFDWLHDDAVPYLADHPWAWATTVGMLVLPGAWSLAEALTTRRARRRG